MLSDPRSIAFAAELVQPQLRFPPEGLQKYYARLANRKDLSFANINLEPAGALLSTAHGQNEFGEASASVMRFAPDRIQFREDWPRVGLDDFCTRSRERLDLAMKELQIPGFSVIQCTVRCLVNARAVNDSRALLADIMGCTLAKGFHDFGREPNLLGLRLAFPGTAEDPAVHNIRIESFGRDPRSIFLEETRVTSSPVAAGDSEPLERAFRESYDFLTDRAAAWLARVGGSGDD
jgi:hypothetical protein